MKTEKIFSPVKDDNIKNNLQNSPIWKDYYKEEEEKPQTQLYCYYIKFDGLTPIQVTKATQILPIFTEKL